MQQKSGPGNSAWKRASDATLPLGATSEFRWLPCPMAEVKNLYQALFFLDLVVNQNRAMQQLSYPRSFSDDATHARKTSE